MKMPFVAFEKYMINLHGLCHFPLKSHKGLTRPTNDCMVVYTSGESIKYTINKCVKTRERKKRWGWLKLKRLKKQKGNGKKIKWRRCFAQNTTFDCLVSTSTHFYYYYFFKVVKKSTAIYFFFFMRNHYSEEVWISMSAS